MHKLNILICGEAGQGIVTIGEMLAKAMVRAGYFILVTQDYQSRIRGGHNSFCLLVGTQPLFSPIKTVNVLLALNKEGLLLHRDDLHETGIAIYRKDASLNLPGLAVPFQELGSATMENTIALGVLSVLLGMNEGLFVQLFQEVFGAKHPEVLQENLKVFGMARAWAAAQQVVMNNPLPAPMPQEVRRLMLNGNQAIALGAMAAGVKFCAFYPMTPATSIPIFLAGHAKDMGLVVEQAEDEIAAINMAIGASFCGSPAMVATSGGGFALMTEAVSLAGMTETPLVIVVAQRPGPATGLPTRTEQGDLEFVLHSGHGEFPRAIFAPGTVEEGFNLMYQAFHLAEAFQGPVFVLTDQFLADSYRAVEPFDLSALRPVEWGKDMLTGIKVPYRRYELTENGVSSRLIPGMTNQLVVADSDEHTEDGHITEDLSVRKAMVEKRLKKLCLVFERVLAPQYLGPDSADILLVSWGSTFGAAREAGEELRRQGRSVANLHFSQVWPLNAAHFAQRLRAAKRIVAVESNATGQFARILKAETGIAAHDYVLRYDGLPFTAEYLLNSISKL